jgi:hypothetical protein
MGYIGFVVYQDYIMNAYLWILLGILYRLPDLARKTSGIPVGAEAVSESGQA